MDIITRNFFRLLRSGALHEDETIEPMSAFKWERLGQMVHAQHVEKIATDGIAIHEDKEWMNLPKDFSLNAEVVNAPANKPSLSNGFLNRKLKKVRYNELHAFDTNVESLEVLDIIVSTMSMMLNKGMMLKGILALGSFLRSKGDKVDFLKLNAMLGKLHLRRMAQLQGSMLIEVFHFEKDELPFVDRVEPSAYNLVVRSVVHTANDTAEEWHFKQNRTGFVTNNSTLLRRNLRRSLRYLIYAPLETISNYFNNFARSLQEIEE